jgi:hypothetical protein
MFQWEWRLLYESTAAEFRSAYGLDESVERLRAATKRSVFSSLGETVAVGKVSKEGVRLQRVIPPRAALHLMLACYWTETTRSSRARGSM